MLPRIRITDLLSEVARWTLFTDCFTHLRSGETVADPQILMASLEYPRRMRTAALSQRRDAPGRFQPAGGRRQCADRGRSRTHPRTGTFDPNRTESLRLGGCRRHASGRWPRTPK